MPGASFDFAHIMMLRCVVQINEPCDDCGRLHTALIIAPNQQVLTTQLVKMFEGTKFDQLQQRHVKSSEGSHGVLLIGSEKVTAAIMAVPLFSLFGMLTLEMRMSTGG